MPGMPLRGDRILRYVNAYCPDCHREGRHAGLAAVPRLSGRLVDRDDRVWLERGCPVHGMVATMYDEDAEILSYLEQWTAPTKRHTPDTPGDFSPAPGGYLRGLGEMQTQHTCILLEDVAEACNLRCPTCFADSSPDLTGVVPVADVLANVDQRLARENGHIDVLMLSGGEPTVHPELATLLDELVSRPITRILLNTNGVRIARDDALLDLLTRHRERVELYLQYDGVSADASRHHRGADLRRIKDEVLRRCAEREIFSTLVMTAALGVNDEEIGDVLRVAMATPYVGGVNIQPQFSSGRSAPIDPDDRLTHTGVLKRLGPQTDGQVTWHDLTALPCSHPHCCSIGYLIRDDAGAWRSLVALIGHDRLKANLGLVANRIADEEIPREVRDVVKRSLLDLLSERSSLTDPKIGDLWRDICENCDLGVQTLLTLASGALPGRRKRLRRMLGERVVRVSVKPFMDIDTMIEERLTQCCVHVGTRDADGPDVRDQCAPFCAVQAWAPLNAQRIAAVASRPRTELPLVDLDVS